MSRNTTILFLLLSLIIYNLYIYTTISRNPTILLLSLIVHSPCIYTTMSRNLAIVLLLPLPLPRAILCVYLLLRCYLIAIPLVPKSFYYLFKLLSQILAIILLLELYFYYYYSQI